MTKLDRVLKSRDITLLTKVRIVKAIVFPVVIYGYESWSIKKIENWSFQTVVLEKTLESLLYCKEIKSVNSKGNQPWIFIGRTDAKAEALILWSLDVKSWKRPRCWEWLRAEGEEGNGGWDGWMASLTQWAWVWASSGIWWWTGRPGRLQSMALQRAGQDLVTEQQQLANLTTQMTVNAFIKSNNKSFIICFNFPQKNWAERLSKSGQCHSNESCMWMAFIMCSWCVRCGQRVETSLQVVFWSYWNAFTVLLGT